MTPADPEERAGARPPATVARGRLRKRDLPRDHLGRLLPPGAPDAMAHLKRLDRSMAAATARDRARRRFDAGRFFEACAHLHVVWKSPETPEGERPAWRALAQLAAGLCHVQRDNHGGALKVLQRAEAGLAAHPGPVTGVDLDAARRVAADVVAQLRAGPTEVRFPRWPAADET